MPTSSKQGVSEILILAKDAEEFGVGGKGVLSEVGGDLSMQNSLTSKRI